MSGYNEMHVEFYNYRVEFQLRGAPNIQGVLWMDFFTFHADARNKEFKDIKEVMNAVGNKMPLIEDLFFT